MQSRTILDAIGPGDVSGQPGQQFGEVGQRGIGSMTAKVLCGRHNSALSPLDKAGRALFDARVALSVLTTRENAIGSIASFHRMLNGHDIERWAMKSLLGMIASNGIRFRGVRVAGYEIPRHWLDVLMGDRTLKPPHGLYMRSDPSDDEGFVTERAWDYGVRPLWDPQTRVLVGVEVRVFGSDWVLWLDEAGRGPRPDLAPLTYRPRIWYGRRETIVGVVEFAWELCGPNSVELSRPPLNDGPPVGHDFNRRWHHYGEAYEKTKQRYPTGRPSRARSSPEDDRR